MKRAAAIFLSFVLCAGSIQYAYVPYEVLAEDTENKGNEGDTEETESKTYEDDSEETENKTYEDDAKADEAVETEGAVTLDISAPSGILMETSTGTILYEKDADIQRPPASVTKVMTMLLIFDALESGSIKLEDSVTTSEFAASMGGSQVFLEPGETQTVETMLKCISVASANDACVAMAEFICGSEEAFVQKMNERAKGLGMEHTNFVNCNGLDVDGHVTTARDIALMSRELLTKYPQIHDYCTIWMENITHTTKKGTTEFGLTNTNKLIRQYQYATGLKTGSTSLAKFCVSASAKKDNVELVAVIMAAEDSKSRFKDAVTLFNHGFGMCQIYNDELKEALPQIKVSGGVEDSVKCKYRSGFSWLDTRGSDLMTIEKKKTLKKEIQAPVKEGDKIGSVVYSLNGKEIGSVDIIADGSVKKAGFSDYFKKIFRFFTLS